MTTYFHELSDVEAKRVLDSGMSVNDFVGQYNQPPWCSYPGALNGLMGCWSLVGLCVKEENYCRDCEYHKICNKLEE